MLGVCLKEYRLSIGLSQKEMAKRANISARTLSQIETGKVLMPKYEDVLKLADSFDLDHTSYIRLFQLRIYKKKFRAFNVGLMKTGTFSIQKIFSKNLSRHEFSIDSTLKILNKYKKGKISKEKLNKFAKKRIKESNLEMDAAFFHHEYLDFLIKEYPEAKFIFTIRDCYSWLDSLVNMYLRKRRELLPFPLFFFKDEYGLDPKFNYKKVDQFRRQFFEIIDKPIQYWANVNKKILGLLPKNRSLIIRTNEISDNLERMSDFIGISKEKLVLKETHTNKRSAHFPIFRKKDSKFLQKKFDLYCQPLMDEFFPEVTLETFFREVKKHDPIKVDP